MERRFVIWLYPTFYNAINLNITPLKSFLISSWLTQLIYIMVIEWTYLL